jgi:hypothetical protein
VNICRYTDYPIYAKVYVLKSMCCAGHQWLTPVILATQEAEIKRITVRSQPREIGQRDPISKKPFTKKKGLVEWLKL